MSFLAAPACSLIDEPAEPAGPPGAEKVANRTQPSGDTKADKTNPHEECTTDAQCPARPHTASWCSPQGRCQFSCEPGFGDANAEVRIDGCECIQENGAAEICNGIDDDCDGVVDNRFVGGQAAAGRTHSCALDADGHLSCWGTQTITPGMSAAGTTFWKLSAGARHSCALDASGEVYCWGSNRYGQAGVASARRLDQPEPLGHSTHTTADQRYVEVSAGGHHSCALTDTAQVHCWGRNDYGQLGDGTVSGRWQPEPIASTLEFVAVSAGDFHTCAATATGQVLCWGANLSGQAGQLGTGAVNAPSPVLMNPVLMNNAGAPRTLVTVAAGANHSCALDTVGRAYCWGANDHGQGGDGSLVSGPEVREVDADVAFDTLTLGSAHTCGLSSAGRLYCWGLESHGRLGIEVPGGHAPEPRPVGAGLRFVQTSAGDRHTCGLSTFGHLYCWGDGSQGQLIAGKSAMAKRPMRVGCR
jgi:alpha-tubulin suppressor-like RCC1 family protein